MVPRYSYLATMDVKLAIGDFSFLRGESNTADIGGGLYEDLVLGNFRSN